jgi:hypothetical protein
MQIQLIDSLTHHVQSVTIQIADSEIRLHIDGTMASVALTFESGQVVGTTKNERGLSEAEVLTGLEAEEPFLPTHPSLRLFSKP